MTELECRDVPAWWSVTAPDPAAGTLGSTSASHAGDLTFSPEYTPDASGHVVVWADTAAEQKPFLATVSGTTVSLAFEDIAGQPGCDYDYNDRTWEGVATGGMADPVIAEGTSNWSDIFDVDSDNRAMVAYRVSATTPDAYRWDHTASNVSGGGLRSDDIDDYGLARLSFQTPPSRSSPAPVSGEQPEA